MREKITGFVEYGFDSIVKFGGSLLVDQSITSVAVKALEKCASLSQRILVFPGGGPTDKTIEEINQRTPFAPETHHHACVLAQDQTGLMICDPAFGQMLTPCSTITDAMAISDGGKIPVLLPSQIVLDLNPFEKIWEITSDGMAVWLAWLLDAPMTAILTNVDGIFPPGSNFAKDKVVPYISAQELCNWGHTAVDRCVPEFISQRGGKAWVGHGGFTDRLSKALTGQPTVGTYIRMIE